MMKSPNKMIRYWFYMLATTILLYAEGRAVDSDADGVPDALDQCPNTPFLAIVDAQGCITQRLYFPQERPSGSLDVLVGYAYNYNDEEDSVDKAVQHSLTVQLRYVNNDWIYAIKTGRFIETESSKGMRDTTLSVTKRWRPVTRWKTLFGASLRLPTYDFPGNRTDLSLHLSTIYYPKSAWSVFGGVRYTFIGDTPTDVLLRDTYGVYAGSGYYVTKSFYINMTYNHFISKYTTNHSIDTLSTTLFYEWDDKWYTVARYAHQILDDDLHHTFTFHVGYRIW